MIGDFQKELQSGVSFKLFLLAAQAFNIISILNVLTENGAFFFFPNMLKNSCARFVLLHVDPYGAGIIPQRKIEDANLDVLSSHV